MTIYAIPFCSSASCKLTPADGRTATPSPTPGHRQQTKCHLCMYRWRWHSDIIVMFNVSAQHLHCRFSHTLAHRLRAPTKKFTLFLQHINLIFMDAETFQQHFFHELAVLGVRVCRLSVQHHRLTDGVNVNVVNLIHNKHRNGCLKSSRETGHAGIKLLLLLLLYYFGAAVRSTGARFIWTLYSFLALLKKHTLLSTPFYRCARLWHDAGCHTMKVCTML